MEPFPGCLRSAFTSQSGPETVQRELESQRGESPPKQTAGSRHCVPVARTTRVANAPEGARVSGLASPVSAEAAAERGVIVTVCVRSRSIHSRRVWHRLQSPHRIGREGRPNAVGDLLLGPAAFLACRSEQAVGRSLCGFRDRHLISSMRSLTRGRNLIAPCVPKGWAGGLWSPLVNHPGDQCSWITPQGVCARLPISPWPLSLQRAGRGYHR